MPGDVYLATNDNLCYVPNFSLLLDGSPGQMYAPDVMSFYRRDPDSCGMLPKCDTHTHTHARTHIYIHQTLIIHIYDYKVVLCVSHVLFSC